MSYENGLESISVEAALTDSGISLKAKSRFVSAVDRLFGGIFSIPAAHLEARTERVFLLADLDRKRLRQKAELQIAGELKSEQLELAAAYIAKEREIKRLLNLAAVAEIALEDLRTKESESETIDEGAEEALSEGWLNWFETYAEKASADDVRQLWGNILAGEVRRPGSFSLSTLRVISESDQHLAELFRKHVTDVFGGGFLLKDDEDSKGEELLELSALEDVGFLREVSGTLSLNWKFDDDGRFIHRTGNLAFVADGPAGLEFQIAVILISRAGLDLLGLFPPGPPDKTYRKLATLMPQATTGIKLGVVVAEPTPNQISWLQTEILKEITQAA